MLTNENLKSMGVEDPDDADEKQQERAEKAAVTKLKNSTKPEYDALLAKAIDKETRDELVDYVQQDVQKEQNHKPSDIKEMLKQITAARQEAERRVDAIPQSQRAVALKEHKAKEAQDQEQEIAQAKADRARHHASGSSDDGDSGGSIAPAVGVGAFIVILLLIFGIRSILFVIMGMALAYKTAAGAVSD